MTRVRPRGGWLCWAECERFGARVSGVPVSELERTKLSRWPRACPRHVEIVELAFQLELAAWRRRHSTEHAA